MSFLTLRMSDIPQSSKLRGCKIRVIVKRSESGYPGRYGMGKPAGVYLTQSARNNHLKNPAFWVRFVAEASVVEYPQFQPAGSGKSFRVFAKSSYKFFFDNLPCN